MTLIRILVSAAAIAAMFGVLFSVLRTVVLPRGIPSRLSRLTFLAVRAALNLRLRLSRRRDEHATRDRVLALQAPLGIFAELYAWALSTYVCFAALFWAAEQHTVRWEGIRQSLLFSGSSMLTLGLDAPSSFGGQLIAFACAGFGLILLALVITYLPSLYAAFSAREVRISRLVLFAGTPPSGHALLTRSWQLGHFEDIEEVWNTWETWFIEIAESHTTFPQLVFLRSPHGRNHWVLAAEAVLDASALFQAACDVERKSRSELCLEAGSSSVEIIGTFLGIPREPPVGDAEIALPRERFDAAWKEMAELGVPLVDDPDAAWAAFRDLRARYEPLVATLGRMTDAPRSDWSSWSDATPRHTPPLLRLSRTSGPGHAHEGQGAPER